jgi:hypothetical protein
MGGRPPFDPDAPDHSCVCVGHLAYDCQHYDTNLEPSIREPHDSQED